MFQSIFIGWSLCLEKPIKVSYPVSYVSILFLNIKWGVTTTIISSLSLPLLNLTLFYSK